MRPCDTGSMNLHNNSPYLARRWPDVAIESPWPGEGGFWRDFDILPALKGGDSRQLEDSVLLTSLANAAFGPRLTYKALTA